jgi:ribosomal protein L37AE/L43A
VVDFPHLDHQERLADEVSRIANPTHVANECQTCHHLDMPDDEATACWECHTDFHQPASIFDHSLHQNALGRNNSCTECHTQEHVKQTAEICQDCHETMVPGNGQVAFSMLAPAYKDAMHGRCLDCHEGQALEQDRPELALCSTCHIYHQNEFDKNYASLSGK